jgi:IPT/TIG domain-containing protein
MRTFLMLLLLLGASATATASQQSASIIAIAPTFGPPGTIVSIRGSGFSGFETVTRWVRELATEPPPGIVDFNGVPGEILFWQDDLISVKVPKGASNGLIRVVLPQARVAITGGEFEVYYSTPGKRSPAPIEFPPERSRTTQDPNRGEREWRPYNDDRVSDGPFYINPWFSSLSPGERTFLGEQGFTNTFLFGNPFSLGRKNSFLFSGRDGFDNRGFDRFGFEGVFFRNFLFRGSRGAHIRPFSFLFNSNPFQHDGHIFRR